MKYYKRKYSLFSLCGLNCGLCPRYQCEGKSKCPGCGGKDFYTKHPTCSVISCNLRQDNVEFCFQCKHYPCKKYTEVKNLDSFISYINVQNDFEKCSNLGIENYKKELNAKITILEFLLKNYNNGKLKQFYCNSVNLLELKDLQLLMEFIREKLEKKELNINDKIQVIISFLKNIAKNNNIDLRLRK